LLVTPEAQAARDEIPELRGTPTTPMAALVDAIVATGVKRIPGGIVADDSRYEELRYLPTWKDSYRADGQVGPLGALTVNGGFDPLRPPEPVADPALFAARELEVLLESRGVSVGGSPTRGTAPQGAVEVGKVQSPPLTEVVTEDLTTSNNLASELLLREIALKVTGQQGTTAGGAQAVLAKVAELGLPAANVTYVDGSGLSRTNLSTCNLLAATLDLGERPELATLWSGLSVAGERGTLVDQIEGPLTGKVRGKTGSLDGVTGLVGIVDVGRPIRFAFLANGEFSELAGIGLRGRIAEIISTFPDAPPADQLVPAPTGS
jgi:D-alanyl-D-alanine carboxypeptidase/D-alanyl-D-alanine-endopeptidase (penicillin-binding protein 4)